MAEAEALADWVALHNRNLETIYITHAHFRPLYGLGTLLDRFPGRSGDSNAQDVERHTDVPLSRRAAVSPPVVSWASTH